MMIDGYSLTLPHHSGIQFGGSLNVSWEPYIQARIFLCGIQRNVLNFGKTYTFELKIPQLTSFIWRSFQYLNLIMFEYDTVHVEYCGHQWHLLTLKG